MLSTVFRLEGFMSNLDLTETVFHFIFQQLTTFPFALFPCWTQLQLDLFENAANSKKLRSLKKCNSGIVVRLEPPQVSNKAFTWAVDCRAPVAGCCIARSVLEDFTTRSSGPPRSHLSLWLRLLAIVSTIKFFVLVSSGHCARQITRRTTPVSRSWCFPLITNFISPAAKRQRPQLAPPAYFL